MKTIVFGLLGSTLDRGFDSKRWDHWRPTVSLCQHEDFLIDRFELLYDGKYQRLAKTIAKDIQTVSPETSIKTHLLNIKDPWDFEEVYAALHDFARSYPFDVDREEYLIHITTGTHVIQICEFLLTESNHFPAKLLQSIPPKRPQSQQPGSFQIIDLDLSRYDQIAMRYEQDKESDISFLKSGIETQNKAFNALIERIEKVAIHSIEPILLMGPTGAGKSKLARRIFELKKSRHKLKGNFIEINCATLRADVAMSTLFGHHKGAFTGAVQGREGLLRAAHGGILFLDEIGELGLDEQAVLLRAIEEKVFFPVGADQEVSSDFQLICGTNQDLQQAVHHKTFREDLLARINLWTFQLPGLRERREDIEPNIHYELERFAHKTGNRITFSQQAWKRFLKFCLSHEALWSANFRDLISAITRMGTLAPGGRISPTEVTEEIERLKRSWGQNKSEPIHIEELLGSQQYQELDRFQRVQLQDVIAVCRQSKTLSEAGRTLFSVSRTRKNRSNDADRLRKYLARFDLSWQKIQDSVDGLLG